MSLEIVKKTYLRILPVQILSLLIPAINVMIDSVITGKYIGTEALASIGLFVPISTLIGITYVIVVGTQILCGRAIGSGDKKRVVSLFSTCMVTLGTFSLVLSIICNVFSNPLAMLLGAVGENVRLTSSYVTGYSYGIIGQVLAGMLTFFLPLNNDKNRSYLSIATMVTTNIALDVLFVTVWSMGTFGMGLATSISYLASFAILLTGFFDRKKTMYFDVKELDFRMLPEAIPLGLPSLMFTAGCTLKAYIMNLSMMKTIGTDAVAVINVQNSVISIVGSVPQGCAAAFSALAAISYGEEDREGFVAAFRYATKVGLVLSAVLTFLIMASADFMPLLFFQSGDPACAIAKRMFIIFPSFLIFNVIFNIFLRCYQSQGKMHFVNIASFVESLIMGIIIVIGAPLIGTDAAWIAFPITEIILLFVIFLIRLKEGSWLRLDADFGAAESEKKEFTTISMDDVVRASESIIKFCKEKGMSGRDSMIAGLCIEEMAGNIINYGFIDGKKHNIDIRVVIKNDLLTIRIRDDCAAFNPVDRMDKFYPDDMGKCIGIRMIGKLTKDISYYNSVGINTLLLKV